MSITYIKGQGLVESPLKKRVKRYASQTKEVAKTVYNAGKTTAKFLGAVASEPFTNRYIKKHMEMIDKNPPASPRY